MRRAVAVVVLALLVGAGLAIGDLAFNPDLHTATSRSTAQQTLASTTEGEIISTTSGTATSTTSSSGLELRIALNATTIKSGSTLAANVTLSNTLNDSLMLPFPTNSTNSLQDWENHDFICANGGTASNLVGFALFKGHFAAGNISEAPAPLQLAAQADLPCAYLMIEQGELITFLPDSDSVSIPGTLPRQPATLNVTTYSCIALPLGSSQCHNNAGLFGYWSTSDVICCPAGSNASSMFRYFTPGEFTLVAEDVWGQSVTTHFRVVEGPSPSEAVSAQESPFSNPGFPVIGLTLANFAGTPITSLNATLVFYAPEGAISYPFAFGVNSSDPLLPGQTAHEVKTLHGDSFDIGGTYPLRISETFANGTTFAYEQEVSFRNSVPAW
jgi:hypothetical protein